MNNNLDQNTNKNKGMPPSDKTKMKEDYPTAANMYEKTKDNLESMGNTISETASDFYKTGAKKINDMEEGISSYSKEAAKTASENPFKTLAIVGVTYLAYSWLKNKLH
jgi:hypothetical protein